MGRTVPVEVPAGLEDVLDALVDRGTLTAEQRSAVLAEMAGRGAPTTEAGGSDPGRAGRPHRRLSDILIEVGLYVGGALVLAAGFVLVAQNWEALGLSMQVAILAVAALVSGGTCVLVGHGSPHGSARRRLAGVLAVAAALSAAGMTGLLLDPLSFAGVAATAVALIVLVAAHTVASSTITEVGMLGASYVLLLTATEALRPAEQPCLTGYCVDEMTAYDLYAPLAGVALGVLWAAVVSRRLAHREVAVFLGMLIALSQALPLISMDQTRGLGMAAMAALAAVGFWGFLAQGIWPWLAAAIASVTALVFWAVGGADRPALAILVAGLVLLGSSALGMLAMRRRRTATGSVGVAQQHAPPAD